MHLLGNGASQYRRVGRRLHHFPQGMVRHLHDIGLLSPRLTLAHCTYCTPEELALIAASGARIAVNTGSNLGLRSGIAPVAQMLAQGCHVAMGLDGLSLDEDDDALRELRLLHHLHKGWGYDTQLSHAQAWRIACEQGRHSISGVDTSDAITTGGLADLLILDGHALMEDRLFDDIDVLDYVLRQQYRRCISSAVVVGVQNYRRAEGRVLGVDLPGFDGGTPRRAPYAAAPDPRGGCLARECIGAG